MEKISSGKNAVRFELQIELVTGHPVFIVDEYRKIRIVIEVTFCLGGRERQATQSGHFTQLLTVVPVYFGATRAGRVDVFQLQQTESGIELAHLAVDARRDNGYLVGETEILS